MKVKRFLVLFGLLLLVYWSLGFQNTPDHKLLFEKAKFAMETKGDLQGAIKLFQEIVAKYPQEKEYAAKAQLYIGLCYEKLGNSEAVKAYELVLKNFADRPEEVAVARERLAALRQEGSSDLSMVGLKMGETYLDTYALSPDATKILGLNSDKGLNVAYHDTVTNLTETVTHFDWREESFWADSPIWSPDGREIAYAQVPNMPGPRTIELRVSGIDGTSRLLATVEAHAVLPVDWLRDGSAIVVVVINRDRSFTLGVVPVMGGVLKNLCAIQTGPSAPDAKVSPDGRFIVFEEGNPGSRDVRVISIDGRSSGALITHPADDYNPLWSPDGKDVVFQSNRHGGDALWGLAVKDGRAAGEPFLIKDSIPGTRLLNWTSQGICYTKTIDITDIFIQSIDPQTNELVGKPRLLSYMPTGLNSCPRWSPDGKHLAFVSAPWPRPGHVRIVVLPSEDGKPLEYSAPIYRWYFMVHALAWLPDSSGLGFETYAYNTDVKKNVLLKFDISTGEWKTWPLPGVGENAWTPIEWGRDGKSFFYAKQGFNEAEPGILEQELAAGKERYIYRFERDKGLTVRDLRCSRDYQWLVFKLTEDISLGNKGRILALKLATGKVRIVYEGDEYAAGPVWSPDGQNLLVLSTSDDRVMPAMIPATGGPMKKLKLDLNWPKGDGFSHLLVGSDWSPDGKQIAFTAWSSKEETFLMKNVIPKDKR